MAQITIDIYVFSLQVLIEAMVSRDGRGYIVISRDLLGNIFKIKEKCTFPFTDSTKSIVFLLALK